MRRSKPVSFNRKKFIPNQIPFEKRAKYVTISAALIIYGTIGVAIDSIYIPGKRSPGIIFHGVPCWIMYFAMLSAALNLISVIVDHFDRRNNERNYQLFAQITIWLAIVLFLTAILADIFVYHEATSLHRH